MIEKNGSSSGCNLQRVITHQLLRAQQVPEATISIVTLFQHISHVGQVKKIFRYLKSIWRKDRFRVGRARLIKSRELWKVRLQGHRDIHWVKGDRVLCFTIKLRLCLSERRFNLLHQLSVCNRIKMYKVSNLQVDLNARCCGSISSWWLKLSWRFGRGCKWGSCVKTGFGCREEF